MNLRMGFLQLAKCFANNTKIYEHSTDHGLILKKNGDDYSSNMSPSSAVSTGGDQENCCLFVLISGWNARVVNGISGTSLALVCRVVGLLLVLLVGTTIDVDTRLFIFRKVYPTVA
jgi:hypothetical protein